jgi:hypothetical protein
LVSLLGFGLGLENILAGLENFLFGGSSITTTGASGFGTFFLRMKRLSFFHFLTPLKLLPTSISMSSLACEN